MRSELSQAKDSRVVCIVCGVEKGCRKPCCNMGNKVCYGDPYDIGDHIWTAPRREAALTEGRVSGHKPSAPDGKTVR